MSNQTNNPEEQVRAAIAGAYHISDEEEAKIRAEMGDDYAPPDPVEFNDNDIGFDFSRFPTLHEMALDESRVKFCIGPAGCLPADVEVLTPTGWVSIKEQPSEIMVYNPEDYTARFEKAEPIVLPCPEGFHRFYNSYAMDMPISDEHKVWYQTYYSRRRGEHKWQIATGSELAKQWRSGSTRNGLIPTVYNYVTDNEYPLSDDELRVQVMLSADGCLPKNSKKAIVTVRKERKKERIRHLLNACGIEFSERTYPSRPTETLFVFIPPEWNKELSQYYGASKRQLKLMADESLLWDGHVGKKGSYFSSNNKANADFIQFAWNANGVSSYITEDVRPERGWRSTYRATLGDSNKTAWVNMKTAKYEHIESSDGLKYCYTTSTGMFVARYKGKVFCTGNSAKTSGIIWILLLQAMMQEPAKDGVRYSRALVVRNTNLMLRSTTIPSFKTMVGNLMTFRTGSFPMTASARFDLNDGTKVHFDVEFMAFDDEKSHNKLLGCEPTFAFIDELSEFPESLVFSIDRRLGRYPSGRFGKATWVGLLGATNGPLKNHWLYQWYLGKKDAEFKMMSERMGRNYFRLFRQPPALLRQPDGSWLPNPHAENIENLPNGYAYYYAMLGADEQKIKAYVEGDFADLVTGKVVFPEFREERHVIPQINLPPTAPIYLSFDFGRTPVCLVSTRTSGGRIVVIDEIVGEDMSIDTLVVEYVKPTLKQKFPHNLVEGATADPSGLVETQAVDVSPFDILLKHGIPVQSPGTNKLQPRLEAVKQALTKLDRSGQPMLQITDNCKYLIQALKYDYIYEQVKGRNGVYKETPTKTHIGWASDLCDSLMYLCLFTGFVSKMRQTTNRSMKKARFI